MAGPLTSSFICLSGSQGTSSSKGQGSDADELAKYGVTPGLLETISGMTYSTFSDYPLELLPSTNPMGLKPPIPGPGFQLSAWQAKHAMLVLSRGDQLQGLRFALCPKRMTEEMFWVIYFTLVKSLLPPEAFDPNAPSALPRQDSQAGGLGARSRLTSSSSLATEPRTAVMSAASSSKHLSGLPTSTSASALATGAAGAAAVAAAPSPRAAATGTAAGAAAPSPSGATPASHTKARSTSSGSTSDDDDDGGDGDGEDLEALEDDPELAAYLNEALDGGDGGEGEGSDLGSAVDDLDDYINALDAELGDGDGDGGGSGDGDEGKE
ncbi:hypothetical protein GPECTOR_41g704 [Gonium pectorale]|uniref:BSD domain-containing protein n=1 Tax=Gonium pectorale TaxID=33097 RepID=A0A150GA72_GONPE|nr:hypothetical protein GPECTOR_41g704 [Gonium pectorale]|eukprot:KXZ46739.1 hypothetical protein GPECTOR_41g704 [Gonium pectorale]